MPSVSVIIATCDRPDMLVQTLQSVLEQDVGAQVIVIDDGVGFSAAAAVRGVGSNSVEYVVNPRPSGGRPAAVRNIGLARAEADLIHFLDDDDIVEPGYYRDALAMFRGAPEIGVVFGRIAPFGEDASLVADEQRYFTQAGERAMRCARLGSRWSFAASMLFNPTLLVCSAGLVRRGHARAIGGFDPALPLVEDVDFYMRAMRRGRARFLDRPALGYRIGPSLMRQANRDRMIAESYVRMHRRYRQEHGTAEFMALKLLAKGLRA